MKAYVILKDVGEYETSWDIAAVCSCRTAAFTKACALIADDILDRGRPGCETEYEIRTWDMDGQKEVAAETVEVRRVAELHPEIRPVIDRRAAELARIDTAAPARPRTG